MQITESLISEILYTDLKHIKRKAAHMCGQNACAQLSHKNGYNYINETEYRKICTCKEYMRKSCF